MNYQVFPVNLFEQNCYVLAHPASGECAIIDCGAWRDHEWQAISGHIAAQGLRPKYMLLTHAHFDHILGLGRVREAYGLLPWYHAMEQDTYTEAPGMSRSFHIPFPTPLPPAAGFLEHGQELTLGPETIRVIHTPGHTPGGVCFHCPESGLLFTGDTLFRESLGRTDLGGDPALEVASVRQKLLTLPPATQVLPGHGPATTIGWEAGHNPYLV